MENIQKSSEVVTNHWSSLLAPSVPPTPRPQHRSLPQLEASRPSGNSEPEPFIKREPIDEDDVTCDQGIRACPSLPAPTARPPRIDEFIIKNPDTEVQSQKILENITPRKSVIWGRRLVSRDRWISWEHFWRSQNLPSEMPQVKQRASSKVLPPVPAYDRFRGS